MSNPQATLEAVRQALRSEPRVKLESHPIHLAFDGDDLVMEGEVADIAAKKLALERAAAVQAGRGILDRLSVRPAERMADGQIRDLVCDALSAETSFADCAIRACVKDRLETVQQPQAPVGLIEVKVADGVVTLDGDVPGLVQKRLAGVLAWWVPGSRDIVNGLGVTPPEEDKRRRDHGRRADSARKGPVRQCRADQGEHARQRRDLDGPCADRKRTGDGRIRCLVRFRCRQSRQSDHGSPVVSDLLPRYPLLGSRRRRRLVRVARLEIRSEAVVPAEPLESLHDLGGRGAGRQDAHELLVVCGAEDLMDLLRGR